MTGSKVNYSKLYDFFLRLHSELRYNSFLSLCPFQFILTYLKVLLDIIVKGYVSLFNPVLVLINSQGISAPDFQM